jgi:2,3-bisphosphoglycerate-dependent phosphoglycerate mutase
VARAWLIRHGESLANAGHATADPGGIRLTERGHEQARRVVDLFEAPPSLIVTSGYLRTQETAAPTRARFGDVPHETWDVHEFTYLGVERCANTTWAERRPWVDEYWERCDPDHVDGAGAESMTALMQRVDAMLARLRTRGADEQLAVFTHGLFMRAAVWAILVGSTRVDATSMARLRAFEAAYPIHNGVAIEVLVTPERSLVGALVTRHLSAAALRPR